MAKLILTHEVTGLGTPGDVVEVKNGYARNYLLPRGFALLWTKGGEKQVDEIRAAREARAVASLEEAKALAEKLQAAPISLKVKAGDSGRLFGKVKNADVADAVEAAGLGKLDKRKIELGDVKSLGAHEATVRLHDDVSATIKLNVIAGK